MRTTELPPRDIESTTERILAWARAEAAARRAERDRAETWVRAQMQADLDDAYPYMLEARDEWTSEIDAILDGVQ